MWDIAQRAKQFWLRDLEPTIETVLRTGKYYFLPQTIFFFAISPFFLYIAATAHDTKSAEKVDLATTAISDRLAIVYILVILIITSIVYVSVSPHRYSIIEKFKIIIYGEALFIPLLVSSISFYIPILAVTVTNDLGSPTDKGFLTASSAVQISFEVYLAMLSAMIVIRYFLITASAQTGIAGFIRNLTLELERVADRREGQVLISLPWLAYGKITLKGVLFDKFCDALKRCITEADVDVRVQTLDLRDIRKLGQRAIDKGSITQDKLDQFLDGERELRKLAKLHGKSLQCRAYSKLKQCVIVDDRRLFIVSTAIHSAENEGHLGKAFLSIEVLDSLVCSEYRTLFE
jgi:hypothetical protein